MDRPEQCHQMKKMRRQLYTSTPAGQNLIARRMSEHYRDCEQCAEWWDWVCEKKVEVPVPSLHEGTESSHCENNSATKVLVRSATADLPG